MDILKTNKELSRRLNELVRLRYEPIAVKFIENEAEVPAGAIYPMRDMGEHMALCQAFALARREKKTVYMQDFDHWCWNPLIGLGHVDCDEGTEVFDIVCNYICIPDKQKARDFFVKFPRLARGKYAGIVTAPLSGAAFDPDLTLIYSNNLQLRNMLWAIKSVTGKIVTTEMDAIDSCIWAMIPAVENGEYRVTLPDHGEYERAAPDDDEIILTVPRGRIEELTEALQATFDRGVGYEHFRKELKYDYPRPPFYPQLFKLWGLEPDEK